ncbi:SubName: Full=Uncharacterized protein {ECO:0000313/EMBL:CCA69561.1} [Serendipita indica DSM 11827]|uniref:Nucleoside transporter n=1 Tax=Serendipita indica (strain DSM 11827) TaxID=1109443 RepID=G4TE18_SERID|nr:SubName: Full=Uncharacterized protein {ECO:0000313/EMBL:CCA69561.1} [Serendipita indica DSM 11827]CCA69561.1 hypothetical protein PIIN_03500 [Serendipita indica DSM 11827]
MLGFAVLLPWNSMITAIPFFLERLSGSALRSLFSSYFSAIYQLASFVALAHASYTAATASKSRRITVSHAVLTVTLGSLFISTLIPSAPLPYFCFALAMGATQAIAGSYLLTSVVSYTSYFGAMAMQSMMSGQAAVAVIVSIVQLIITLSTSSRKPSGDHRPPKSGPARSPISKSATYFFLIATFGLSFSYMAYRRLTRMPLFRKTVAKFEGAKISAVAAQYAALPEDDPTAPLTAGIDSEDEEDGALLAMSASVGSLRDQERTPETQAHANHDLERDTAREGAAESEPSASISFWKVWWTNAMYNVSVMIIYIVTLALFPAVTAAVRSVRPDAKPQVFTAVHFLVYNSSDWFGRFICSFRIFQIWSRKKLMALSVSRIVFVVLFLACNVNLSATPPETGTDPALRSLHTKPEGSSGDVPLINSDAAFFALLAAFGVSNGWLTSLIMMAAPSLEHNKRMRKEWVDVAAVATSFSLATGLVLGSIANFGIRGIACGCNPLVH